MLLNYEKLPIKVVVPPIYYGCVFLCSLPNSHVTKFFFPFIFISWRLITLQYCSGFCHTLTWISYGFTCVPHPNPLPATSLPIPPLWVFPVHQPWALVSGTQPEETLESLPGVSLRLLSLWRTISVVVTQWGKVVERSSWRDWNAPVW